MLRCLWAVVVAWCCVLAAPAAQAQSPRFEVRSASVATTSGVWLLNVRFDLGLSEAARAALAEGIPLTMTMDVAISRTRAWLPDEDVAALTQRWQIEWHALSERYIVINQNSGEQSSFPTLDEALLALAEPRGLPILDTALTEPGRRYEVSVRGAVEIGGLPDTLKLLLFWREWQRSTEWYTWSVRT